MKFKSFSSSENPTIAVIALHGLTGNVNSMIPVAKMLKLKHTMWIIPQAPYKSKKKGYSWYYKNKERKWKFEESFKVISEAIQLAEKEGFKKKNIFILGFSQGASITLEFLISQNYSLGGIIPIAGFFKFKNKIKNNFNKNSRGTPILLLHGKNDKIVLHTESEQSYKILESYNYLVSIKLFSSTHKIPLIARQTIQEFIYG